MKRFVVSALLLLLAAIGADARFPRGGSVDTNTLVPSQRTVLNMNFMDGTYEYRFIDHVLSGDRLSPIDNGDFTTPGYFYTPANPFWSTGSSNANLDSNGYPQNVAVTDTHVFGNHILLPASTNYGGTVGHGYVIKWTGDCRLNFTAGTWTTQSHTLTNYTLNGNGDWSGTTGEVVATYTGSKAQIGWRIARTGQFSGAYCRDVHIFREDDRSDFDAGKVFRTPWKNIILTQDPSVIRFMNWHGGNDAFPARWDNRAPYPHAMYGGNVFTQSPPYGDATASTANVFTASSATGMPVAMQHGEIATVRLATSMTKSASGGKTVTAIAKCNGGTCTCSAGNGQVTSTAHGWSTGDKVIFQTATGSGMTEINLYNSTVTVCDADHFNTTIDTTSFTTFTSGTVAAYVTLNIGARGAYPIMSSDATTPLGAVGSVNYFHQYDIRTLYFDKTVAGSRDGSGNLVAGVWLIYASTDLGVPQNFGQFLLTPPEICAQLVKELNDMSPVRRIDMWLNIPARAMMTMDPDYTSGAGYTYNAINAAKSILPASAHIFVEYSNETWNEGGAAFTQVSYVQARAYLRSGRAYGLTSINYFSAVRSVVLATDISAALGADPRVHLVLAGQGYNGIASGSNNYIRAFGDSGVTSGGQALYYGDAAISALPTIAKTGNTHTSGTIDGIASTTSLTQGMWIECADCGSGVQITSVIGANSIAVSPATTATNSSVALTIAYTPINYHWGFAWGSYFDPPTSHTTNFTASIAPGGSAGVMTVTVAPDSYPLVVGDFVVASGISTNPNTTITGTSTSNSSACGSACTGSGSSTGTYAVSVSQTLTSRAMTKNQYMNYTAGTGTFTDDSALYSGTNNTVNGGGNYVGVANPTQAVANFVAQVSSGDDSQSTAAFKALAISYSAAFAPLGKYSIGYEGGAEWQVQPNDVYGGHTLTANDSTFMLAAQGSSAWSTAFQSWLTSFKANSLSVMPPLYVMVENRWGYTTVNNGAADPDTYSGGVEGGALNTTWTTNGTANQSISP